jgi:hypothetical protein
MHITRSVVALDPRRFGRRRLFNVTATDHTTSVGQDLRLFLSTFAAGFVFVTVLIV